jgi:single-strand DNA-binding protein
MPELRLPRVNRVLLAGRVTRDFAVRYTTTQVPVVTFTVAFNRPVKGEDGTWSEVASFVNVLASGRLAEQCGERLKKGSALYLEGRLQMRKFEARSGQSRSVLEIKAEQVQFLDRREDEGSAPDAPDTDEPPRPVEGDLPF